MTSGSKTECGQEKKNFSDLSDRQKNRRADDLGNHDVETLLLASIKAAKAANQKDLEYVLRLMYNNKGTATEIRSLWMAKTSIAKPAEELTPLRGLIYLLDNNLSKAQYNNTRLLTKEQASNIFPAYNKIREMKKDCRPPESCLVLTDISVALPLQGLLNHTVHRLLLLQEKVLETLNVKTLSAKMQGKWGADGSSDHSRYNQKFLNGDVEGQSDGNLFAITMVPLRLTTTTTDMRGKILWNNSAPSHLNGAGLYGFISGKRQMNSLSNK